MQLIVIIMGNKKAIDFTIKLSQTSSKKKFINAIENRIPRIW